MLGNRKIFISHAHEDNDRCAPLLAALDAWGADYWFDTARMDAGDNLSTGISQAIAERDIFLRVCTPAAMHSYWVQLETAAFRGLQAQEHHSERAGARRLINLILDSGYVPDPLDYATLFINAHAEPQAVWLAELRRALAIAISDQAQPASPASYAIRFGDAVALRASNGNFVSADVGRDARLYATATRVRSWEVFEIVDALNPHTPDRSRPVRYGDQIALRATKNQQFVGAQLGMDASAELTAVVPWVRRWERFVLTRLPQSDTSELPGDYLVHGSRIALLAGNGKFVSCRRDTDQILVAVGVALRDWETFTIERP